MKGLIISILAIILFFITPLFAQHVKKDGTPDMRYKENKSNYSTPSSSYNYSTPSVPYNNNTSTLHLKKDGSPDLRYKENKTDYSTTPSTSLNSRGTYPKYNRTNTGKQLLKLKQKINGNKVFFSIGCYNRLNKSYLA